MFEEGKVEGPPDLKTPGGVKDYLRSSKSQEEWDQRCSLIQALNDGQYPKFWLEEVIQSNLMKETASSWGGSGTFVDPNKLELKKPTNQ